MGDPLQPGQVYPRRVDGELRYFRYLGGEPTDRSSWSEVRQDDPRQREAPDARTGAPMEVRAAVASARTPEDRLATLRNFFPDAVPLEGGENYIFTHPESGRPTLFDETEGMLPGRLGGIRLRDIIGDGAPFLGEMIGGVAGAAAGTGGGVPGIMAGSGLGATAGRELVERTTRGVIPEAQDTRSPLQQVGDAAVSTGVNAAGEGAGMALSRGLAGVGRNILANPAGQAAARQGVDLSTAQASRMPGLGRVEAWAAQHPAGAGPMGSLAQTQNRQMAELSERIGRVLAGDRAPASAAETERVVQERIQQIYQGFQGRRQELDDRVLDLIGERTPIGLDNSRYLLMQLRSKLSRAPRSLAPSVSGAVNRLENLLLDAEARGGKLDFGAVREIRTSIGKLLDSPQIVGEIPSDQAGAINDVYQALKADLLAGADEVSPEAGAALRLHDRFVRFAREEARRGGRAFAQRVAQQGRSVTEAMTHIRGSSKVSGAELAAIRNTLARRSGEQLRRGQPDPWGAVASTIWEELGTRAGSDGFSPAVFLRNYRKLDPSARRVLFSGTPFREADPMIQDLLKVAGQVVENSQFRNFSNTGSVLITEGLFRDITRNAGALAAGAVTGIGTGNAAAGLATTTAGIVGARQLAKAMASPRFVRWLSTSARQLNARPNTVPAVVARGLAIAEAEPEIAEYVRSIIDALERSAPDGS